MDSPRLLLRADRIAAVEKPAGWVVHATRPNEHADLRTWVHPELGPGWEAVHRLDRDTSGVVILGADPEIRAELSKAFAAGEVRKTYLALVQGRTHEKGVIRIPLSPDHPGPPQAAVTRYRTSRRFSAFTLLRVNPETGRKHQVRRHLSEIGHPVIGDTRYDNTPRRPIPGYPGRLWLHAARIELPGERVFESPLPPSLAEHLEVLAAADAAWAKKHELGGERGGG